MVIHSCPVAEGITRITFRLPHHALGVALMVTAVLENHVVVTTDIKHLEVGIIDFPVAIPGTEGFCDRTCVINLQDSLLQQACCMDNT